ncbi:MAG TPA: glutamine amidotransferase [Actinomycetaceae bacterium]|nr:glutamine amidotransferase [Actinomycetaceae bacterium]
MKPYLLISTRPEDHLADQEREAFARFGGLDDSELVQLRLEKHPLPAFDPDQWSGVMLGGSPFDASTPRHLKSQLQLRVEGDIMDLLDIIVPLDFPFLGACYGVGTLALHQGGRIDTLYSEPAGAVTIRLTPEGQSDPLVQGISTEFRAFVGHHEACSQLPSNATLLASSAACPVQMFRIKRNLYGTQFHPELDVPGFIERVNQYRTNGYFDDFEAVRTAALRENNSLAVNRMIANFVKRYAS